MNTALVLSGGGARAAYQVGVLLALAEEAPEAEFPILTGVSAGAINAAYLAAQESPLDAAARGLRERWAGLSSDMIYGVRTAFLVRSAARWMERMALGRHELPIPVRGLFDTGPLRRYLEGSIRFPGIEANLRSGRLRAVALTASSYALGSTVTFVQGGPDVPIWERVRRFGIRSALTLDHVMASSAIPIIFPAVRLDGGYFGDGSVLQPYPLSPAVHLGARRVLAVSTRPPAGISRRAADPPRHPSPAEALGLLLDSVFMDHLDADAEGLLRLNRLLAALPPGTGAPDGLRPIEFMMIRPSRDLGAIALECAAELPKAVRAIMKGMGGEDGRSGHFLSYLLFDPAFTARLIELGKSDARAQAPRLRAFFGGPGRAAASA